ncbi:peregrin [Quercus suber]|uniref:Peregrin n=1 Tax=Quercus suber TaxID=58331 RepID=A0AAW0JIB8_QUESU
MDSNFHGLPPLKRFRLIQQQQRDTAVSPSRLPAKKRKESRILPSFPEPTHTATTYCLPAKKRVWALLPDFIADVSLQAKKGVGSHQPDFIADEAVTISLPFDLNSPASEEEIPLVDGTNESLTNASQDENEDDGIVCAICQSTDGDPTDPIVFCDGCDLMVHATCYGNPLVKGIPEGDWHCSQCLVSTSESNKGRNPSFSCCLCPTKGGALKPTVGGRWAHLVCALLVPEVFFADAEGREGIDCSKVPKKRWEEKCYVCKSRSGCAVECSEPKCHLAFHVTCGLKEDLCIEYREQQQTGKFKIVAREEHMK